MRIFRLCIHSSCVGDRATGTCVCVRIRESASESLRVYFCSNVPVPACFISQLDYYDPTPLTKLHISQQTVLDAHKKMVVLCMWDATVFDSEWAGACWVMNGCDLDRRQWELVSSCFSCFIA